MRVSAVQANKTFFFFFKSLLYLFYFLSLLIWPIILDLGLFVSPKTFCLGELLSFHDIDT